MLDKDPVNHEVERIDKEITELHSYVYDITYRIDLLEKKKIIEKGAANTIRLILDTSLEKFHSFESDFFDCSTKHQRSCYALISKLGAKYREDKSS